MSAPQQPGDSNQFVSKAAEVQVETEPAARVASFDFYRSQLKREHEKRPLSSSWVINWRKETRVQLAVFTLRYRYPFLLSVMRLIAELMDDPTTFPRVTGFGDLRSGRFGNGQWRLLFFVRETERLVKIIAIDRLPA